MMLCLQVTPKPATSFDANILSVASTAPRFSYLPISTPSLYHQPMRHMTANSALPASSGAAVGLVPSGPAGLARPSYMLEQTGDYSFANINVGRAVSAVAAEQQRAVESASGTTLEVSLCCIRFCLTLITWPQVLLHLRTAAAISNQSYTQVQCCHGLAKTFEQ